MSSRVIKVHVSAISTIKDTIQAFTSITIEYWRFMTQALDICGIGADK